MKIIYKPQVVVPSDARPVHVLFFGGHASEAHYSNRKWTYTNGKPVRKQVRLWMDK